LGMLESEMNTIYLVAAAPRPIASSVTLPGRFLQVRTCESCHSTTLSVSAGPAVLAGGQ
jgi:hypothetical protein